MAMPVPRNDSKCHGSPANHFTSSQTIARTSSATAKPATGRSEATMDVAERLGAGAATSAGDGLVGDVECAVDDLEALGELVVGDAQRRVRVDRVVRGERVQTVVAEELRDRLHLV